MRLWYPTPEYCKREVFPVIQSRLSHQEEVPFYEQERRGMETLASILAFMQSKHYGTFDRKAAYLICSIVTGHGFSNGNKRLAVTTLLAFLIYNRVKIRRVRLQTYKSWIAKTFPGYRWQEGLRLGDMHMTFLYHIAVALADRPTWGDRSFDEIRASIARFFGSIYVRS
jgi:prophage maintenance system killer protein